MATAYLIEIMTRCRPREPRLWLPTDPIPDGLAPEGANRGIFEALHDQNGRVSGPGTWVGVTGLSAIHDQVSHDLARSAGIAGIVTPLARLSRKGEGACFGVTLVPGFPGTHRLAVVFTGGKAPPLRLERTLEVLSVCVTGIPAHTCNGELRARIDHVPRAVMAALRAGKKALELAQASRGISRLGAFEPTGPASGALSFTVAETQDDQHVLAITARCPEDGRTITAASARFLHQAHPRVVLRGPAAARSVPAEPPALYRIGPFDGMREGDADLVHAVFGDLRTLGHPYKGKPWSFQLRAQPYRTASGAINRAVPGVEAGQLETTEGGDLGVVIAADASHPRQLYALVEGGKVSARRPILPTGNAFLPADGTFPEMGVRLAGAGIEKTILLPDHAVLFFLDEYELTSARDGLLRTLDTAADHAGTPVLLAVHALAPCGCVSRLELEASAMDLPSLSIVGGMRMEKAHP